MARATQVSQISESEALLHNIVITHSYFSLTANSPGNNLLNYLLLPNVGLTNQTLILIHVSQ